VSLFDIFKQLNWADVVFLILFARTIYVATSSGLLSEAFKLPGTILAAYLSLHYYSALSHLINSRLGSTEEASVGLWALVCFVFLALTGYLFFVLLRYLFLRFVKIELAAGVQKWGGFFLGLIRACLLVSLIVFILLISPLGYFGGSARKSYTGKFFFSFAPATYSTLWNGVMSKFMSQEKYNVSVQNLRKAFEVKKKAKK